MRYSTGGAVNLEAGVSSKTQPSAFPYSARAFSHAVLGNDGAGLRAVRQRRLQGNAGIRCRVSRARRQ